MSYGCVHPLRVARRSRACYSVLTTITTHHPTGIHRALVACLLWLSLRILHLSQSRCLTFHLYSSSSCFQSRGIPDIHFCQGGSWKHMACFVPNESFIVRIDRWSREEGTVLHKNTARVTNIPLVLQLPTVRLLMKILGWILLSSFRIRKLAFCILSYSFRCLYF